MKRLAAGFVLVVTAFILTGSLPPPPRAACEQHPLLYLATGRPDCMTSDGRWHSGTLSDLSSDGRFVLFEANLEPGAGITLPCPDCRQLYLHDREAGITEIVSVNRAGEGDTSEGHSFPGTSVSDDGRYVLYDTRSLNVLTDPAYHGCASFQEERCVHAVIRDRLLNTTTVITPGATEGYYSDARQMSGDGSLVMLFVYAKDDYEFADIYLLNRQTQTTQRISELLNIPPTRAVIEGNLWVQLSDNGRYAGIATDTRLTANDQDDALDLYKLEMQTGAIELIATDGLATETNAPLQLGGIAHISNGGRYAAYNYWENGGGSGSISRAVVYDFQTRTNTIIHPDGYDPASGEGTSFSNDLPIKPVFTHDERYLMFASTRNCQVYCESKLFVRDLQTGTAHLVSRDAELHSRMSGRAWTISGDGNIIAEMTDLALLPLDIDESDDIYLTHLPSMIESGTLH
jgi:hypothetical protein